NAMAAAGAPGYAPNAGCIGSIVVPGFNGGAVVPFNLPGGFFTLGGSKLSEPLRQLVNPSTTLDHPATATHWAISFAYTPTNFLRGPDVQAPYWIIKINGVLRGFTNPTDSRFQDPTLPFAFATPEDLRDPSTGAALCPSLANPVRPSIPIPANLAPSACAA